MSSFRNSGRPAAVRAPLLWLVTLLIFLASGGAFAREQARTLPQAGEISVQEAAALLADPPDGLIVLDVRTPQEFREGHLAGARNMDFFGGAFEMQTADLPRDVPLLIYCRSGKRSAAAAESLAGAGATRILHMTAGTEGWKAAGLPLEK